MGVRVRVGMGGRASYPGRSKMSILKPQKKASDSHRFMELEVYGVRSWSHEGQLSGDTALGQSA